MRTQAAALSKLGIRCLYTAPVGEMTEDEVESKKLSHTWYFQSFGFSIYLAIRAGEFSVLLSSPEALVCKTLPWQKILKGFGEKLCLLAFDEAHVITEWSVSVSAYILSNT
jgi:superfamily II DNA helicase RecQ